MSITGIVPTNSYLRAEGDWLFQEMVSKLFGKIMKLPSGPAFLATFNQGQKPITIRQGRCCAADIKAREISLKFWEGKLHTLCIEEGKEILAPTPGEINLLHELCHFYVADQRPDLDHLHKIADRDFDNLEEKAVIMGEGCDLPFYENLFRKEMGQPKRINHAGLVLEYPSDFSESDRELLVAYAKKDETRFTTQILSGTLPTHALIRTLLVWKASKYIHPIVEAGLPIPEIFEEAISESEWAYAKLYSREEDHGN